LVVALLALSGGMGLGDAHHGPEQPIATRRERRRAAVAEEVQWAAS
jgi:hypothetical protein